MAVTTEMNQTSNEVQRLSPHLIVESSAQAIEFYQRAFGAKEEIRLADDAGRIIHACVSIGDFHIMMVDQMAEHGMRSPGSLGGSPVTIHLMVRDVDAFVNRAVEGEVVTITRRGKPVARLVSARPARRKIALATLRTVSAATPPQPQDSAALLRRMREDARY